MSVSESIRLIADRFVDWQTPYGRPDPEVCPFVFTDHLVTSVNFHSPTFMAIGLYQAAARTGEARYKAAADRYIAFYFSCLRNPSSTGPDAYAQAWIRYMEDKYGPDADREQWAINIINWPFIYGMALAGFRHFRQHNPDELALDSKAAAVYEWLLQFRWDQGSYFRNGYGSPRHKVVDAGNSDDNCHMGRGLMGYYQVSRREDVLADACGLASYYLSEAKLGQYQGCWSSQMGTWVIAPTVVENIEHFSGKKSIELAWGFSSVGAIDFLVELYQASEDETLKARIAATCAESMKWHFDACQFEDGAVGMSGRDDKWLGMTAGALLSYLRTRDAGLLNEGDATEYRARALRGADWLLAHITPESIDEGGYFRVTGQSEPRPPENLAWLLGWTLEALTRMEEV